MENANNHNQIEQTLNSLNGIQRAEANPFLFTRVMEKMRSTTQQLVKPVWIWRVAVSFMIIVALNISIGIYISSHSQTHDMPAESGYFSTHLYNY